MSLPGLQKLPDLFSDCTITENIDGLTAAIHVRRIDAYSSMQAVDRFNNDRSLGRVAVEGTPVTVLAASKGKVYELMAVTKNRFLNPEIDSQGFAAWVWEHADELVRLGPGRHVGRWWGQGINRGYGLEERRFSLVNYERWSGTEKPSCVHVVPMLYKGPFSTESIADVADALRSEGSFASPGYDNPLGLIVYHHKLNNMFKVGL